MKPNKQKRKGEGRDYIIHVRVSKNEKKEIEDFREEMLPTMKLKGMKRKLSDSSIIRKWAFDNKRERDKRRMDGRGSSFLGEYVT